MRYLPAILLFLALSAYAAESKHDKDVRECKAEAAKATVKHPAEVKKAQLEALNKCMRSRGYATGQIRAK